jgi:periplasmic divalent cation tolerance protein
MTKLLSIFYTRVPDNTRALDLVKSLLEERLIACGNLIPQALSCYWWEGKIVEEYEVGIILKTSKNKKEEMIKRLLELHPYKVPAIIELNLGYVNEAFEEWIFSETTCER